MARKIVRAMGAGAFAEIARILVRRRRKYAFGHHVADRLIQVPRSQPMRVALDPLSERWIAVGQLIQTGERTSQNHEGVINQSLAAIVIFCFAVSVLPSCSELAVR